MLPLNSASPRQPPQLACNRAAAHAKLNRHAEAAADCTAAIELDPSFAKAYLRRALALTAMAKHEEALRDYEHLAELDSENPECGRRAVVYGGCAGGGVGIFSGFFRDEIRTGKRRAGLRVCVPWRDAQDRFPREAQMQCNQRKMVLGSRVGPGFGLSGGVWVWAGRLSRRPRAVPCERSGSSGCGSNMLPAAQPLSASFPWGGAPRSRNPASQLPPTLQREPWQVHPG